MIFIIYRFYSNFIGIKPQETILPQNQHLKDYKTKKRKIEKKKNRISYLSTLFFFITPILGLKADLRVVKFNIVFTNFITISIYLND